MNVENKADDGGQVCAAVLAASVMPAVVFCCFMPDPISVIISFIIALLHAMLLGIPLYDFLKKRHLVTWQACLLGGFVVGIVPASLLMAGWINSIDDLKGYVETIGEAGLFGAIGGISGWVALQVNK